MSSKLCVQYGDRSFWTYDILHDIFLKYLIDAAAAYDPGGSSWLAAEIESWRFAACIIDVGIALDEDWSAEQRQTLCKLIDDACKDLASRTSIPPREILQWPVHPDPEMRIKPRGGEDVPIAAPIRFGHALRQLLAGQLPDPVPGTDWYIGLEASFEPIPIRSSTWVALDLAE